MIGIYRIHNLVNDKNYIGKSEVSIEARLDEHRIGKKSNFHLQSAIKKYGIENFEFLVLEECSPELCCERERYWIKFYDSFNNGYNDTTGGENESGWKMSKSGIEKRLKKIDFKGENNPFYGRKHSDETRKKISEGRTGNKNPCSGKVWIMNGSESKRVSKSELQKYLDEGWIKGRYVSSETRRKHAESVKERRGENGKFI